MSLREEILIDKLRADLSIENAKLNILNEPHFGDTSTYYVICALKQQSEAAIEKIKDMLSALEKIEISKE